MLGEHRSSRHRIPNDPGRQQLQEGKILVELREREECHLLQHPHSLPRNAPAPAKIETSWFCSRKHKGKGKKGVGRGCGEKQPKKRNLLNGILCQLRVYK